MFHRPKDMSLPEGYQFEGYVLAPDSPIPPVDKGNLMTGAYIYWFRKDDVRVIVPVVTTFLDSAMSNVTLVVVPRDFRQVWWAFEKECARILQPKEKVMIIGGRQGSFKPSVDWDEIVLPDDVKRAVMDDVQSFFDRGIAVYQRLNLKPFRKLLLAGVPGTGKTMLCNALAKWALDRDYRVIYVSSSDFNGPTFVKIQQALEVAHQSEKPTMILLEELDAYLHQVEKAIVLNTLDGAESIVSEHGTLLIATTNYPQAIDERVLKRPGRLDRIFIIPEIQDEDIAERMLKRYLGDLWQPEHASVAPELVGYPGAFVREVAIYALTQSVESDLNSLPVDKLEAACKELKSFIEARDAFVASNSQPEIVQPNGHPRQ
jgi:SpoVK/Ycf46/Vps4 family AAA+-type ATPase